MVPLEGYAQVLSIFTNNITVDIILILLLLFLLIGSAFFSSTETAFSSINIIRLKNYLEEKRKGARKAVYIAEKFDLTLTTLLIGNNFVNIFATTIAAFIFSKLIVNPTLANIANTFIMTVIVLIFGEIIPKSFGKDNPEKVALKHAGVMFFLIKLLYPLSWIFLQINRIVKISDNNRTNNPYVTEEELESIIDVMENEGVIDEDNADLIQSALNLNLKTVYDIMTPRVDVVAIDINDSIDVIKETFFTNQFSRIPVYQEDKDNMIGILSERDFFTALIKNDNKNDIKIQNLITKPYFVSKTTKVDDLIKEMQLLKKHFAIVSDEYGGTSGIVTMEDALEELVGEIYDEYDEVEDQDIVKIDDSKYLVSTEMDLDELFDVLNLGEAPMTKYSSVGGFVYELCEGLPIEGKSIHISSLYENYDLENPITINYDLEFVIKKVENRRIRSIELIIKEINE